MFLGNKLLLLIFRKNLFLYKYVEVFKMINSIFISLLVLSSLIAYKRFKRKKRLFHAPPTNQLPS